MSPGYSLPVFAVALLVTATGCTGDQILGTAYNVGRQHSCMQAAGHRPNESMEEFKCMSAPQEDRGPSWEEYRQAREEELGRQVH